MKKSLLIFILLYSFISFSQKYNYHKTIDDILIHINKSEYSNASLIVDSVLELESKILKNDNKKGFTFLAKIYGFKGQVEWMIGNPKIDSFFLKSVFYATKNKDSITIGKCFFNLGLIYEIQSDYPTSINYYIKCLPFLHNDCALLSRTLDNIGYSLSLTEKNNEAYLYIHKAYKVALKCNDKHQIANIYNSIAAFFIKTKQHNDSVIYYSDKAIELGNKINNKEVLSIANSNYADFYHQNKDYQKSIEYNLLSLAESKELNNLESEAESLQNLGYAYQQLNEYNLALNYYSKTLIIADKINAITIKTEVLKELSTIYEILGNHKKSLFYFKEFSAIKDSLVGIEKTKAFDDILIKYETEKITSEKELIEKEKVIVENKNEKNKNYLIGSILISTLLVLAFVFLIQRVNARKKAQIIALELSDTKKRLALEKEQRKSELKALKSQMNPHFIFNALNSIKDLVLQGNVDSSYSYITKFSNLVRKTLNHSNQEFISFEDEIKLLELYLTIEKLRFKKDFTFNIVANNIEDVNIPPMLIQPFIENALIHGLLHKEGLKTLSIKFELDEELICTIKDNGVGRLKSEEINQRKKGKEKSFSVNAIQQRFSLFKETFGNKIGIKYIDNTEDDLVIGTTVILKIPFVNRF